MNSTQQSVLNKYVRKMKTSANIWAIIGIYQIIVGFITLLIGYGVVVLILGIWNLVQSGNKRKSAKRYAKRPVGILAENGSGASAAIMVLVNLFLGAVLGAIGSIYDFTVHNYVSSNREIFKAIERSYK